MCIRDRDKDEPVVKGLFNELKKKASLGYDYASAEASVELLILRKLARRGVRDFFKLVQYHVSAVRDASHELPMEEATVMVEVEGLSLIHISLRRAVQHHVVRREGHCPRHRCGPDHRSARKEPSGIL